MEEERMLNVCAGNIRISSCERVEERGIGGFRLFRPWGFPQVALRKFSDWLKANRKVIGESLSGLFTF